MSSFKATLRPAYLNKARAKARVRGQYLGYKAWEGRNKEEAKRIASEGFNAAWAFCAGKPYRPHGYKNRFQVIAWQKGFKEGSYNFDINH